MHILFVCTGNICRSPTAERLTLSHSVTDIRVSSAGLRAAVGRPIHPYAAINIKRLGGDADDFKARQLTRRIAADADLVITMTSVQREAVLEIAPRGLKKTFTLSEASALITDFNISHIADMARFRPRLAQQPLADILDPIGQPEEYFAEIARQIADLIPPLLRLRVHTNVVDADQTEQLN